MRLNVFYNAGNNGKSVTVDVLHTAKVEELFPLLDKAFGVPAGWQTVLFGNTVLAAGRQIRSYGVMDGSALTLVTHAVILDSFKCAQQAVHEQERHEREVGLTPEWLEAQFKIPKILVIGPQYKATTAPPAIGSLFGLVEVVARDLNALIDIGSNYARANGIERITLRGCPDLQTAFRPPVVTKRSIGVSSCPRSLETLVVKRCPRVRVYLSGLMIMPKLQHLELQGSVFVNTAFDPEHPGIQSCLPRLRTLRLTDTNVSPELEQLLRDRVLAANVDVMFVAIMAHKRRRFHHIIPPEIWLMIMDFVLASQITVERPKPIEIDETD